MAATYNTPGVYIEEISKLPTSVAEVETAIPAFFGYTEKDNYNNQSIISRPLRIKTLFDYEMIFGGPCLTDFYTDIISDGTNDLKVIDISGGVISGPIINPHWNLKYRLYYCLQMYFANGGGPCYIVSCGKYKTIGNPAFLEIKAALDMLRKEDEPTMIVFCDAVSLTDPDEYYGLYKLALAQASELMDRVVLMDLYFNPSALPEVTVTEIADKERMKKDFLSGKINMDYEVYKADCMTTIALGVQFRESVGNDNLSYGAAYFPWLITTINYFYDESLIIVTTNKDHTTAKKLCDNNDTGNSIYHTDGMLYLEIIKQINFFRLILPPTSAIAGVYAMVDNTRGVWKAPANVSLVYVKEPLVKLDDDEQAEMNVSVNTGKSINAIRAFTGKGVLVWGARTLAGNDNEWKYVSVRRFYNMVEESVKKATEPFVFESNDANTWIKVRAMIENYLTLKWRDGAMMGAKPDDAFFVRVGLGQTMTADDINNGRMIIEIGMAVVRPAEFIILRFSHKMVVS